MTVKKFPGWRWGKDHPEGAIFDSEDDVPKGYVDDPNLLKVGPEGEKAERARLAAELKAKGIKFFAGATTEKLRELRAANLG